MSLILTRIKDEKCLDKIKRTLIKKTRDWGNWGLMIGNIGFILEKVSSFLNAPKTFSKALQKNSKLFPISSLPKESLSA